MNTPESNEGNIVRYAIYFVAYLIVAGVNVLAIGQQKFNFWWGLVFFVLSLGLLYFYIVRFNRENRYFSKSDRGGILGNYGIVIMLLVIVVVIHVLVSYAQTTGKIPKFGLQKVYLQHATNGGFWFLIFGNGIILSILQQFLTNGFLFNYWFRGNEKTVALIGVAVSGLLFAVINFPGNIVLFLVEFILGVIFAWSYLYTQTLMVPLLLSLVSSTLMFVLF